MQGPRARAPDPLAGLFFFYTHASPTPTHHTRKAHKAPTQTHTKHTLSTCGNRELGNRAHRNRILDGPSSSPLDANRLNQQGAVRIAREAANPFAGDTAYRADPLDQHANGVFWPGLPGGATSARAWISLGSLTSKSSGYPACGASESAAQLG